MTARVAAVVLGWNGREDTLACLRALQRATYPELSIVVVDNGSTDGGPEAVAAEFPDVRLLQLGENPASPVGSTRAPTPRSPTGRMPSSC